MTSAEEPKHDLQEAGLFGSNPFANLASQYKEIKNQ